MINVSYQGAKVETKKTRAKNLRKAWLGLAATLLVIGIVLAHTWQQSRIVSLKKDELGLIQEWSRLEILNEQLRSELAALKSLERIDRIAREDLGLVSPIKTKTIVLPFNDIKNRYTRAKVSP